MSRLNTCAANHHCCWLCDAAGVPRVLIERGTAGLAVDFHGEKKPVPHAPFGGVAETCVPAAGSSLAGGFE